MRITVQKYGGTSLSTPELRNRVAEIIRSAREQGSHVVVVVSAIGRLGEPYATDTLLHLVKAVNPEPAVRELDMIMSCGEIISGVLLASHLSAQGLPARFFTGQQAGIVTDGQYGNGHILTIKTENIIGCLEQNIIPVVAGFQGLGHNGEIVTLGRGGSDTTASALAAALKAEVIDIFTDVEGVMTADPRIVTNARLLDSVTYNEVCQLAREGAKVVHPRAVEIAMHCGIPLRIKSTLSDSMGTLITNNGYGISDQVNSIMERTITGITYTSNIAQIKINIAALQDKKGVELKIFKSMAQENISVDFITLQPDLLLFTVLAETALRAQAILNTMSLPAELVMNCAKVAVVGAAMTGIPGVMAQVMEALNEQDIPILQCGDSYTNIWCLVDQEHMQNAVKALHDKFELGKK
ncbi:MAG: aspartate kinase [Syntrophomonadaceae bacterium]